MIDQNIYKEYLSALLKGNRSSCQKIAVSLKDSGIPILTLYEDLFKESLYQVGKLWEANRISISAEHIATFITEGIMNELFRNIISSRRISKTVVVSGAPGEEHRVGSIMVADVFEKHGWDAFCTGPGVPVNDLQRLCRQTSPEFICLSVTVYTNISSFVDALECLRSTCDKKILIGGQALNGKGEEFAAKYDNVSYLRNVTELDKFLAEYKR